ncbi:MAG TPA: DUF2207 domain-containing protein, partial [Candidatus Angelobacter sp.]|nr:DUF2207 domain-containing protein [Candidatus Angelobacter sp.]
MNSSGHNGRRAFPKKMLAVVLLLVFSLPAWARSYRVSKFNSTIHVEEDGSVRIQEQISFVFSGSYQGVYRTIPVDYPGTAGSNYTLFIKVDQVTDENGNKLKYEKSTKQGTLKLKIFVPGAEDAEKTVNIEYSSPNATRFFEDHDEFYWNVTGNDWPVPIGHATAIVYFPPNATDKLRAQAFEGIYGASEHG